MLFGRKQSLVGLDIGSHTIKAVELEPQNNRGRRLVHWGISPPLAEAIVDGEIMDRQLVTDAISNLFESREIKSVVPLSVLVRTMSVVLFVSAVNRLSAAVRYAT